MQVRWLTRDKGHWPTQVKRDGGWTVAPRERWEWLLQQGGYDLGLQYGRSGGLRRSLGAVLFRARPAARSAAERKRANLLQLHAWSLCRFARHCSTD